MVLSSDALGVLRGLREDVWTGWAMGHDAAAAADICLARGLIEMRPQLIGEVVIWEYRLTKAGSEAMAEAARGDRA